MRCDHIFYSRSKAIIFKFFLKSGILIKSLKEYKNYSNNKSGNTFFELKRGIMITKVWVLFFLFN